MNKTSFLYKIESSIPSYIRENYTKFTDFILKYYEYLENDGVMSDLIKFKDNLYGYDNDPEYIKKFISDMGFDIGVNLNLQPDLQYKIINDFFAMRGSEPSLKLLFRLLFNEDVSIEYPRDKLLYLSNANYTKNIFLITSYPDEYDNPDITFSGVVGLSSKHTATIENVDIISTINKKYLVIECSNNTGNFLIDEVLQILMKNKTYNVINVGVFDIDISDGGNGYSLNDMVYVSGCGQSGVGYVSQIGFGSIHSISILNGGTNYKVGETIKAYNGFFAKIKTVDEFGSILSIDLLNGGYKYKEYPELTINSEIGSGAILISYSDDIGAIKKISFDNPYALCTNNSIISVSSNKGYGFIGNLVVSSSIYSNKWLDKKGFIGVNSHTLDSLIYQEYSYKVLSVVPKDNYYDKILELTHPYGFYCEAEQLTEYELSLGNKDATTDVEINVIKTEIDLTRIPMYSGDSMMSDMLYVDKITLTPSMLQIGENLRVIDLELDEDVKSDIILMSDIYTGEDLNISDIQSYYNIWLSVYTGEDLRVIDLELDEDVKSDIILMGDVYMGDEFNTSIENEESDLP